DPDFNETMWRKQRAILRGEGYNLVESLRRSEIPSDSSGSPWGLVRRPVVAVYEESDSEEDDDDGEGYMDQSALMGAVGGGSGSGSGRGTPTEGVPIPQRMGSGREWRRFQRRVRQRFETFTRSQPFFQNF
ncbi:hypothetical protein HDU98_005248, partial [Podochytrium sp. JEL0797]